jgi:hypothetical protein
MENLNRYLRLPFAKQRLLIESTLLLMVVRIGLRILPFKTLHQLMQNLERRAKGRRPANDTYQDDIAWAVNRTGENLFGENTCLPLALTGQMQLNLHGFPASTRLGVQKTSDDEIIAHAWVECNGQVLIGGPEQEIERYTVLSETEGLRD